MKQIDELDTLTKKHKAEVAKRYGITQEQLKRIGVEGVTKNWMP